MFSKKRILLAILGATAAIAIIFTQTALSPHQYKLGGAFIGDNGEGDTWSALQIPKDPNGKSAAVRISYLGYGTRFADLLAAFGADSVTDFVGEAEMTGRDTGNWAFLGYAVAQGNPQVVKAIFVIPGTLEFNGPDSYEVNYTTNVYLAADDADMDGYPDPGTVPALAIPGGWGQATRVPVP